MPLTGAPVASRTRPETRAVSARVSLKSRPSSSWLSSSRTRSAESGSVAAPGWDPQLVVSLVVGHRARVGVARARGDGDEGETDRLSGVSAGHAALNGGERAGRGFRVARGRDLSDAAGSDAAVRDRAEEEPDHNPTRYGQPASHHAIGAYQPTPALQQLRHHEWSTVSDGLLDSSHIMTKSGGEIFSSRWAVILAGLGMAVGTGNLWRFPRIVAQNGGAAFLIPWLIFLVIWSLPIMIAEFGIGRAARRGPIGAITTLVGPRHAWMGGFIAVTTIMIMFYYAVVTGWALKYVLAAVTGQLDGVDGGTYWTTYSTSIWQPLLFHVVAVVAGTAIVARGVTSGIERANRILIPLLFVLLLVAVTRAVTLPGAGRGLSFLFRPDLSALASYRTWLEALTQSAWSTGAGWGLILAYGVYVRREEDVVVNAAAIGVGNNVASLLAGMAVLPTAFALLSVSEALDVMASGNIGLTFIWIPQLFAEVPGGAIVLPVFFVALSCAALSSLIAMIELATRVLIDGGMTRSAAVRFVTVAAVVCGIPSAVSLAVFENQDWVWGLALMISGLFVAVTVIRYGPARFRRELIELEPSHVRLGRLYDWVITYLVPTQFAVMFGWWMYQAVTVYDPEAWWHPIRMYSVGTCVLQWGVVLIVLRLFNDKIAAGSTRPA